MYRFSAEIQNHNFKLFAYFLQNIENMSKVFGEFRINRCRQLPFFNCLNNHALNRA